VLSIQHSVAQLDRDIQLCCDYASTFNYTALYYTAELHTHNTYTSTITNMLQVVDVDGPFYKKSSNTEPSHLKNLSINPFSSTYLKPISPSLYNPHSNATRLLSDAIKADAYNRNSMPNIEKLGDNHSSLKNTPSVLQPFEERDVRNDRLSNNASHDSAVSTNDGNSCLQNSSIKSDNMFHIFAEQSDSGIDINRSSNLSDAYSLNNRSIPTTSTLLSRKSMKLNISKNSLFSSEQSLCEIASSFPAKFSDLKSSYEKNDMHSLSSLNNSALSLKYRKNIHYIQNNTNKINPKRYVKWRKASSCTSVHKMATVEKYKFLKTRSFPNISKHYEEQYSDTFLQNALGDRVFNLSDSHASIFSKLGYFSLCQSFPGNEHDSFVNPYCLLPEKTIFKKKYASLSKSLPLTSNGKIYNVRSVKTDLTDLKTRKEQSSRAVSCFNLFTGFKGSKFKGPKVYV